LTMTRAFRRICCWLRRLVGRAPPPADGWAPAGRSVRPTALFSQVSLCFSRTKSDALSGPKNPGPLTVGRRAISALRRPPTPPPARPRGSTDEGPFTPLLLPGLFERPRALAARPTRRCGPGRTSPDPRTQSWAPLALLAGNHHGRSWPGPKRGRRARLVQRRRRRTASAGRRLLGATRHHHRPLMPTRHALNNVAVPPCPALPTRCWLAAGSAHWPPKKQMLAGGAADEPRPSEPTT